MAQRGRPRKLRNEYKEVQPSTRDPVTTVRDPIMVPNGTEEEPSTTAQRFPRRYIAANMPTVCPECHHNTRQDDGRHVDPVR